MRFLLLVTVPLIILDQLTKWLIQANIPYGGETPVIPGFFSLVHDSNTGAAFSILQGNNVFFIGLAAVALLAVLFWLVRNELSGDKEKKLPTGAQIALCLFAAGITGNLLDRILKGSVVDFLHFYIQRYAWPSFNVADSCICIAAAMFALLSFQGKPRMDANKRL